MALTASFAAAEGTTKGTDFVRVVADQMHQLEVVKVVPYAFSDQRSAIGQIAFNEDASTIVLTPFSGRVIRLIAKVGDQVKRGDPLLEIDSPEQVPPQNDFIAAQTARNKARSQLNLAQIVEKRARDLYEGKAAPFKDLQQAEAQLAAAESDMRSTDTAFDAVRIRLRILGRTDAEISELEQRGTISRVTRISAPIDGTVISRKVGPGQYVKADSGEALYVIADLSTMWLKAQIFEQDIASVRVGQEIEAKVAAAPNRIFKARIANISSASDLNTRRIMVRSEIGNSDGALKSEMFASFKIGTGAVAPPRQCRPSRSSAKATLRRCGSKPSRCCSGAAWSRSGSSRTASLKFAAASPSANWSSDAARFSSITSGVNDQLGRGCSCCVV